MMDNRETKIFRLLYHILLNRIDYFFWVFFKKNFNVVINFIYKIFSFKLLLFLILLKQLNVIFLNLSEFFNNGIKSESLKNLPLDKSNLRLFLESPYFPSTKI